MRVAFPRPADWINRARGAILRLIREKIIKRRALTTLLLCTAPLVSAQGPDPKMKVEKNYATYCAACHGDKFQGGQGGVLVDGEWKHGGTDADITRAIAKGNLQLGMTPWEGTLSPDQIRAMVVFLREKEKAFAGKKIEHPKPEPGKVTKTKLHDYTLEMVAERLDIPWAVAFLPRVKSFSPSAPENAG